MEVLIRTASISILVLLFACSKPDDSTTPGPTTGSTPAGTTPTGSATGTPTGTPTGTTTTSDPCVDLDDGPLPWTWLPIAMEEDFDIDADGYALVQAAGAVVGRDLYGDEKVVSATASTDPSGIQVLSNGMVIVGDQDGGSIKVVDPTTGGWTILAGGMTQPNGLEIGANDRVYVSEMTSNGRVRWVDQDGTQGIILENTWMPNGIVLSPDEQVLYIGGHTNGGANSAIIALDRINDDEWDSDNPRILFESGGGDFDGVETDICGNVYTVEYTTGRVVRIAPDGSSVTEIADLDDPSGWGIEFNALRWGNGVRGWDPEVLYVTDRNFLYPVEVGVPGKPSPSSVWTP